MNLIPLNMQRLIKLNNYYEKITSDAQFSSYSDKIYYTFNSDLNIFILPKEYISDEELYDLFGLFEEDLNKDYDNEKEVPFLNLLSLPIVEIKKLNYPLFTSVREIYLEEVAHTPIIEQVINKTSYDILKYY